MGLPVLFLLILLSGAILSTTAGKLTPAAAFTGCIVALFIFAGAGYPGVAMLATFFILATLATSWKRNVKEQLGIAEGDKGRRKTSQVLANSGVAAFCGFLSCLYPENRDLYCLMMAGSLASATSDTFSSELGSVYGKRFYNILTLKPDQRGKDGVISVEGLLAGFSGALIIALIACTRFQPWYIILISLSGMAGNIADSILGAYFERKHYLGNDAVNFLNTLTAALVVWAVIAVV